MPARKPRLPAAKPAALTQYRNSSPIAILIGVLSRLCVAGQRGPDGAVRPRKMARRACPGCDWATAAGRGPPVHWRWRARPDVRRSPDDDPRLIRPPYAHRLFAQVPARVTHRLEGRFTGPLWASDSALLLDGAKSLVWRAPWTGTGDPTTVNRSAAVSAAGRIVAVDQAGCLQRLGEDGKVTAANCGGWTLGGSVSPDGRYVPLQWPAADGTETYGVLDVMENKVMPWPIRGFGGGSWLGPADVLLGEVDAQDSPATVRCDLTSGTCVRVPDELLQGTRRGATWIGK